MNSGARILVVDDEAPIRRLLRTTLSAQGFHVIETASVAAANAAVDTQAPDLVLLDLGLPDEDGLQLLQRIRAHSDLPVIVLSSRATEAIKVQSLDQGADDYVTKPFGAEELMARIRTALRHRLQQQNAAPVFRCGTLSVDLIHRRVRRAEQDLHLSPKEYDILRQLVLHANKVLTHRHLLHAVWGSGSETDIQYLRVYIRQLRCKLETTPDEPQLIITEPGVGYRLLAP